jgi:uncharacterized membrane protein YdjX (TVP38/TMEM64 family)
MIPFMSPSNIIIASGLAFSLPWTNPIYLGILVALASSIAKLIHFYTVFFLGNRLSQEKRTKFEKYKQKTSKFGTILLFLAAISPIPDEPVVIPLGLLKYNPTKFFIVFLAGKLSITIPGAYLGSQISLNLSDLISNPLLIILSLGTTILIAYLFLKVDVDEVIEKLHKIFR